MPSEQVKIEREPGLRTNESLDRDAAVATDVGVGIPIDEIADWVNSWDTSGELPMPRARKVV